MNFRLADDIRTFPATGHLRSLDSDFGYEAPNQRAFESTLCNTFGVDTHVCQSPGGDLWVIFNAPEGAPACQYFVDGWKSDALHRVVVMAAAIKAGDWETAEKVHCI